MKKWLAVLLILACQKSIAITAIADAGCYQVAGKISKISDKEILLTVDQGTRSEQDFTLQLKSATTVKAHDLVLAKVLVDKQKKISVQGKDLKIIPEAKLDLAMNWTSCR